MARPRQDYGCLAGEGEKSRGPFIHYIRLDRELEGSYYNYY